MTHFPESLSSFDDWLASAGWHRSLEGRTMIFVSPDGRTRYFARQNGLLWAVSRASRTDKEYENFTSLSATLMELFLIGELQSDLRERHHYREIMILADSESPASGYLCEELRRDWWGVFHHTTKIPIAETAYRSVALQLTYLASHSPEEVRAAFADPTGEPLFAQFLQPPRPPADLSGFRKLHGIPDPKETDAHD